MQSLPVVSIPRPTRRRPARRRSAPSRSPPPVRSRRGGCSPPIRARVSRKSRPPGGCSPPVQASMNRWVASSPVRLRPPWNGPSPATKQTQIPRRAPATKQTQIRRRRPPRSPRLRPRRPACRAWKSTRWRRWRGSSATARSRRRSARPRGSFKVARCRDPLVARRLSSVVPGVGPIFVRRPAAPAPLAMPPQGAFANIPQLSEDSR